MVILFSLFTIVCINFKMYLIFDKFNLPLVLLHLYLNVLSYFMTRK